VQAFAALTVSRDSRSKSAWLLPSHSKTRTPPCRQSPERRAHPG
jgi:hypothetical protein